MDSNDIYSFVDWARNIEYENTMVRDRILNYIEANAYDILDCFNED